MMLIYDWHYPLLCKGAAIKYPQASIFDAISEPLRVDGSASVTFHEYSWANW